MPEAPACPVAPLAREAHRLFARYKALADEAERLSEDAARELDRRLITPIIRRIYALEGEACHRRALSAEGAMFQLSILSSMAATPGDALCHAGDVERLCHSVMGRLEALSGLRREDVLGQTEMARADDPFAAVEDALAGDEEEVRHA